MQINNSKLLEVAEEFKIAKLKADLFGINGYVKGSDCKDLFQVTEEGFRKLALGREYTVERFTSCFLYEYKTKVDGVGFYVLTDDLLFDGDENKIIKIEEEV